jgi:type IV pilus assembly protein PilA
MHAVRLSISIARMKKKKGFTLIEILIVIGIIAVLAGIVIVAINPAKQFAQARNTERQSHVETILNAIGQRMADNLGTISGSLGSTTCPVLPTSSTHIDAAAGGMGVNLSCLVPTYVAVLPTDPDSTYASSPYTGYDVSVDPNGRVSVCSLAAAAETAIPGAAKICVTR